MRRYLLRRHARDEADDLLQETFMQAICHTHRLMAADSPRAWLIGVARHLSLSAIRRRASGRQAVALDEQVLAARTNEAEGTGKEDDRLVAMRTAIDELPDPQREVLLLRLQDELSYEQIAAVVGAPIGTVRSRIHYAVKRLRSVLSEQASFGDHR
ncbi:MAG: sigma-70 family RNA polymerase sigma factor [Rhodospirillales bacterium]|nr:sigma-70 family RNA polymerase sigma factor [Rhodospirillales bacterium]